MYIIARLEHLSVLSLNIYFIFIFLLSFNKFSTMACTNPQSVVDNKTSLSMCICMYVYMQSWPSLRTSIPLGPTTYI